MRRHDRAAAAGVAHRRAVERHGVLARADQEVSRPVGHLFGSARGPAAPTLVTTPGTL
jgi:hypothetical protein